MYRMTGRCTLGGGGISFHTASCIVWIWSRGCGIEVAGPALVLYSMAVSFSYCEGIACGLQDW